jgi:hypothetical protein
MPTYDYRCDINGRVVEVSHRMSEKIATWGELCSKASIAPGDTALETPVMRMATGGNVIRSIGIKSDPAPACSTGSCCAGGMCGLG